MSPNTRGRNAEDLNTVRELSGKISSLGNKSFLITGGNGKLANAFKSALTRYAPDAIVFNPNRKELNVEKVGDFEKYSKYSFDFVIHCAAKVNADFCETNFFEAKKNIVDGTRNVTKFALDSGSQLFFPQSFLIYDGKIDPVDEDTAPNPLSNYGKLKVEAENVVQQHFASLIVRMGGFFGGGARDSNFVGKFSHLIRTLLAEGQPKIEVGNRTWQPTYIKDLAENSLLLLALEKSGIYIMAGHEKATFFDVAQFMVTKLRLGEKLQVIEMPSDNLKFLDVASRPASINMVNKRLASESLDFQRDWQISLDEYMDSHEYTSVNSFRA